MSISLYDEAFTNLILGYIKDPNVRIYRPEETKELFSNIADANKDKPIKLPLITLSRDNTIEILNTNKNPKSFDGIKLQISPNESVLCSAIPIKLQYQLDVWTQKQIDAENYIREFVFLLINNPMLTIYLPYNGTNFPQSCHLKMAPEIIDNSDTEKRLFKDQFTRMTLTVEIDDAYLYSIPIKKNAYIDEVAVQVVDNNNKTDEMIIINDENHC